MGTGIGIFIDTAGWIALIYRHDDYHQQAKHIYANLGHVKLVMRDKGITKAFTTDHHFEQAGFEKLLGK